MRIDQAQSGRTPLDVELSAGQHLIAVESAGYITDAHYIEVPTHTDKPIVHRIVLARGNADAASTTVAADSAVTASDTPTHDDGSTTNYIVAGVLGAIAIPLLVNAIYGLAKNGDCTDGTDASGNCENRAELGPLFWTSLGLGSAAALGSAAVLVFEPFSSDEDAAPEGASVSWKQTF